MKPRDPEALRLEDDYLARVRAALAGRPADEIAEVVQSIREHIDESAAAPAGSITLSEIAAVIERLGPPAAYISESSGVAPHASAPPTVPAGPAVDYVRQPFEFGRIVGDAATLYGQNFLPLLIAALIFHVLSICSLGILVGPLTGGIALMVLHAIEQPEHKIDVGDMFRLFGKFWPLLGLFLLEFVAESFGMLMCFIPGLLLLTVWGYATIFMVEKGTGVVDSLRASFAMVTQPGRFLTNFILTLVPLLIISAVGAVAYVGGLISIIIGPLCWIMWVLAYVRQTRNAPVAIPTSNALSPKPAVA